MQIPIVAVWNKMDGMHMISAESFPWVDDDSEVMKFLRGEGFNFDGAQGVHMRAVTYVPKSWGLWLEKAMNGCEIVHYGALINRFGYPKVVMYCIPESNTSGMSLASRTALDAGIFKRASFAAPQSGGMILYKSLNFDAVILGPDNVYRPAPSAYTEYVDLANTYLGMEHGYTQSLVDAYYSALLHLEKVIPERDHLGIARLLARPEEPKRDTSLLQDRFSRNWDTPIWYFRE